MRGLTHTSRIPSVSSSEPVDTEQSELSGILDMGDPHGNYGVRFRKVILRGLGKNIQNDVGEICFKQKVKKMGNGKS